MTRQALMRVAWLAAGNAATAGLYVALIDLPDATGLWIGLSLLLTLVLMFWLAVVNGTALAWWWPLAFRQALGLAVRRGVPALLVGFACWYLLSWGAGVLEETYARHRGEIDAWFLSTLDTTRTAWLHRAMSLVWFLLRDVIGVSLALALFAAILLQGVRGMWRAPWLRTAFSRFQLGLVAIASILFVAIPWRAVGWRPRGLPPNAAEMVFVGAKLTILYLVATIGWTLMLFAAARAALRAPAELADSRAQKPTTHFG